MRMDYNETGYLYTYIQSRCLNKNFTELNNEKSYNAHGSFSSHKTVASEYDTRTIQFHKLFTSGVTLDVPHPSCPSTKRNISFPVED